LMAALDPIHIASVLSAFNCNRRELHHWVTCLIHVHTVIVSYPAYRTTKRAITSFS